MAGRRAKPLQLHLADGKSRLTIAEKERRAKLEAEMRFGTHSFIIPDMVKRDKVAKKKWGEIIKLFTEHGVDFVTTADTGILERYCMTYSEYVGLQAVRAAIVRKGGNKVETYMALNEIEFENSINKKIDLLTKLEDRLFLNPLSKIKNIPKKAAKAEPNNPEQEMFG